MMVGPTPIRIEINGCEIEVLRQGTGTPLLFLHGAGGLKGWAPFLEELSKKFDVIAPSHPGFGRSDTPVWLEHFSDLVFFYCDFLEQLDLTNIQLIGHSMGGWLASELAIMGTGRFQTLTIVSAAGLRVVGVPMGDIFMWSAEERARKMVFDPVEGERRAKEVLSEEDADIALKNTFTASKLCWSPRFHNPYLEKRLHRITIPTMLMWGEHDPVFPSPDYPNAWHRAIKGSELRIFPNCAHSPQTERLDDFLAGIETITKGTSK
ncbi:MAG: alpha/beta hydrolase [Rhodospirillaceae bacterium]|jgi:pimeloyl-ACP methyl ester carboxylesterase